MIFDFPEIYQITRRSSDIYYEDDEPYRVLFAAELGWVVIEKDLTWGKKIRKKKKVWAFLQSPSTMIVCSSVSQIKRTSTSFTEL